MPDPHGFLRHARREPERESVDRRLRHSREFERSLPMLDAREQATRCMGCGVPFCHTGCPLGNVIPDWNDSVREERWEEALAQLEATNNFPEITGRVCPAPCEAACVVGINGAPVAIKSIERAIADRGHGTSGMTPRRAKHRTQKRIAVVGSGPAGLACAQELARAGHDVRVLERDDRLGGLLRYGIPDFKLEKSIVEARITQLRSEGVVFETHVEVGKTVTLHDLRRDHDAVVLATGAGVPRDLQVPGRTLGGVHFAMDYLTRQNKLLAGDLVPDLIDARGKHVVIIGGGDTGSDCLGTALRQGAASIVQLELMPRPPDQRAATTPWPLWPLVYRTSSSQEEGGVREYAVRTQRFLGTAAGHVAGIELVPADSMQHATFSPRSIPADLVLLAMGFVGTDPRTGGPALAHDARGTIAASTHDFSTNLPDVFACGDARRGQSLVVWAIWEGRETARAVDAHVMGRTSIASTPYVYAP